MSKRPDYEVFVSQRKEGDEKAFYTRIGAGWNVAKEGISITLQCVPVDGKLVLFPVREDDQ